MPLRPLWPTAAMHPLLSGGRQPVGTQLMDLPASSARDIAARENPVDQWGQPLRPELRASGQQIAQQELGMSPGWGAAGVGLGLEVLLDPLAWSGAGAAAGGAKGLHRVLRPTTKMAARSGVGLGAMLAKPGVSQVMESARLSDALAPTGKAVGAMGMEGPPVPQPKVTVPFYSRLVRAAEGLPGEKIKTQSLLNQLKKAPEGFSMEEYQWSGVEDFIKGKPVVQKSELLKHLEENRPRVITNTLESQSPAVQAMEQRIDDLSAMERDITSRALAPDPNAGAMRVRPTPELAAIRAERNKLHAKLIGLKPAWESIFPTNAGTNYAETLFGIESPKLPQNAYTEPWWNQSQMENMIGHTRTKQLVTDAGEQAHFIGEHQSDLHQAGAQLGYQGGEAGPLLQRENELLAQRREILDQAVQTGGSEEMNKKLRELSLEAQDVSGRLQSIRRHAGIGEQAPDLPLKGGAWADAMLKRELANAVENNSDVLMWANAEDIGSTTGGIQKGQAKWYTPPEQLPAAIKDTLRKGERPDNLADRLRGILKKVGIDKEVEKIPYSAEIDRNVHAKSPNHEGITRFVQWAHPGGSSNPMRRMSSIDDAIADYSQRYNTMAQGWIDSGRITDEAVPMTELHAQALAEILERWKQDNGGPLALLNAHHRQTITKAADELYRGADWMNKPVVLQARDVIFEFSAGTNPIFRYPLLGKARYTQNTHGWGVRLTPEDKAKIAAKGLSFMGVAGAGAAAGLAQPQEQP